MVSSSLDDFVVWLLRFCGDRRLSVVSDGILDDAWDWKVRFGREQLLRMSFCNRDKFMNKNFVWSAEPSPLIS